MSAINIFILIAFSTLCLYPIYFFLINSFSSTDAIGRGVFFFPREWTLHNYYTLFTDNNIAGSFTVSAARTLFGTILTCVCSSFVAYMFTQKDLPGRKLMYRLVVITMYLNAGLIPWYIVMKAYGLKNNFLLYILPYAVTAFYVILVKTYFESLSPALEESAAIDGAGILRIYASIIMPLSLPVIASVAVFAAVGQWNAWYDNFMLVSDYKLKTLQLVLYDYMNKQVMQVLTTSGSATSSTAAASNQVTPMSVRITITMVTMFPIMLVYPLLQKYFIKGIMLGAVKG